MAQSLERRRLAIAQALRAVMAEPLRPVTTDSDRAVTVMPHQSTSAAVTKLRPRSTAAKRPSIAAAPPAGAEQLALDVDLSVGEPTCTLIAEDQRVGEARNPPAAEASYTDTGSGAANVPPIDTVGSMSRVASLALFGHA